MTQTPHTCARSLAPRVARARLLGREISTPGEGAIASVQPLNSAHHDAHQWKLALTTRLTSRFTLLVTRRPQRNRRVTHLAQIDADGRDHETPGSTGVVVVPRWQRSSWRR